MLGYSHASFNKILNEMDRLAQLIKKYYTMNYYLQNVLNSFSPEDSSSSSEAFVMNCEETPSELVQKSNGVNSLHVEILCYERDGLSELRGKRIRERENRNNIEDSNYFQSFHDISTVVAPDNNSKVKHTKEEHYQTMKEKVKLKGKRKNEYGQCFYQYNKYLFASMPCDSRMIENSQKSNQKSKNSAIGVTRNGYNIVKNFTKQQNNQMEEDYSRKYYRKMNKISKEYLRRLQYKKSQKKPYTATNRKQLSKRYTFSQLQHMQTQKSINNFSQLTKPCSSYPSNKSTANNTSSKTLYHKPKPRLPKPSKEKNTFTQWAKYSYKKKLNRVNICKLQYNIKRVTQSKKLPASHFKYTTTPHKEQTVTKRVKLSEVKRDEKLRLNFTDNDNINIIKKLAESKNIEVYYCKMTEKYLLACSNFDSPYLYMLAIYCREPTYEAIFKIKLLSAVLLFFSQFSMFEFVPLAHFQLKTQLSEEQVMRLLGKPNEFSACMTRLPSTLAKDNKLSIKACSRFFDDFKQINEQLDQELEFFLLKKTKLYVFCHGLIEYLRYLLEEDLVDRTEEDKLTPIDNVHIVQGYYSSRSQRYDAGRKSKKKIVAKSKGVGCDSDRKMTLYDEYLEAIIKQTGIPFTRKTFK